LAETALQAPPMKGTEYLNGDVLAGWWADLDELVRGEISAAGGDAQAWLRERNPLWRLVGRVTFHLAENKRDPELPFAFMATYANRLSAQARVQHQPLGRALQEYAGAKNRAGLLNLLTPIQRAAERSELAKELVESGEVYHPLAWTPREAYRFLQDVPVFEESGLVVRVPDWWKAHRPPRPVVSVKVGDRPGAALTAQSLLDFSVGVTLDGEPLSERELRAVLESAGGLVPLKGKWVEVDREKLAAALEHWKKVEREAKRGGVSFFEGMRLLSGAALEVDPAAAAPEAAREWTGIAAGEALERTLRELRDIQEAAATRGAAPPDLRAQLRPYQQAGVNWLRFMTRLGLGACLADDMGLGKTMQVLALLLHARREQEAGNGAKREPPALLVVPASLIANWKAEIARFAPSLSVSVVHPSEAAAAGNGDSASDLDGRDLVITTYGMLSRLAWLREQQWGLVILDEAQAIKNSGTRQTRAVKELRGIGRLALTGTPVENRLSDLWSLFDFLNPGLLGGAKAFSTFAKRLETSQHNPYGPLRSLVRPYILRRLKTDKRVIADLPDKTEVNAFCGLSKLQAAMYEQSVSELGRELKSVDGIQRRGVVLSYLMRFKQICNHPSQVTGDGGYNPQDSGKFRRLGELCEELAERQERPLVFTQFREITAPLADFLAGVFGRPGLVLHGQTPVGKRRGLVEAFQREDGPPFFVLSLKAGGTGLNLTAASHVIHFDRWWNPAVENQATDRAFRIGQKKNVFVHKFVCRGTVEDRIDEMISRKSGLAKDLLEGGGEAVLTEMDNQQLLRFVSLDISKAIET
jgi:non-specific serine/threonine protein kinase